MLLTTPQELRQYLPTHVFDNLKSLYGYIDSSEHDFLLPKIGKPLYTRVTEEYKSIEDKNILLPEYDGNLSPWQELIKLCQKPVAFDTMYRASDVSSISVNEGGLNVAEAAGYESAGAESIERYKRRLNMEAHKGIDLLLVTLMEWAEDVGSYKDEQEVQYTEESGDAGTDVPGEDEGPTEEQRYLQEKIAIISLWKKSRYYYLSDGLFINTASKFNEFVDIYENSEKFIKLIPDLRYCQEFVIRPELGDELTDSLINKKQDGTLNEVEKHAVYLIQYTLALKVEVRSKMFDRIEAKDEAISAMRRMLDYLSKNQDSFQQDAVRSAPFYKEEVKEEVKKENEKPVEKWENNRKGNYIFVTMPIE